MTDSKDRTKTVRTVVDHEGTIKHYDEAGRFHNEEGPAIVYADGSEVWLRHGKIHRSDGPAIIQSSGKYFYYLDEKLYSESEYKMIQLFKIPGCAHE